LIIELAKNVVKCRMQIEKLKKIGRHRQKCAERADLVEAQPAVCIHPPIRLLMKTATYYYPIGYLLNLPLTAIC
jgi:hypothetical protein